MTKTSGLRFLQALEFAKVGNKICREAWEAGRNVFYVPKEAVIEDHRGDIIVHDGVLAREYEAGDLCVWYAEADSILADDWAVV